MTIEDGVAMILRILSCLLIALALCLSPIHASSSSPQPPEVQTQIEPDTLANPDAAQPNASALHNALVGRAGGEIELQIAPPLAQAPADGSYNLPEISATSPLTSTPNLELLGHIGGSAYGLAILGDYAYIGEGPTLAVLDITGPYTPTLAGRSELLPYRIGDIDAHNDYVYATDNDTGLHIFDASDLGNLHEVGSIETPFTAMGVVVSDTLAYVADNWGGLRIIDVNNPDQPAEIGFVQSPSYSWYATELDIRGSLVYLVGSDLVIIDVSNPMLPTLVSRSEIYSSAYSVVVDGTYAFIGDFEGGLRVIDVSDPNSPSEVGYCDPHLNPYSQYRNVLVSEGFAFLTSEGQSMGFYVIDVSDPTHPVEVTFHSGPSYLANIDTRDNILFGLDSVSGLWKFNVSNPSQPALTAVYRVLGETYQIDMSENVAYAANGYNGLYTLEVSNPSTILPLSRSEHSAEDTDYSRDLIVLGNHTYITEGNGLRILDTSDPAMPEEASYIATIAQATAVFVLDDKAYIGTDEGHLYIVDVSNPVLPDTLSIFNASTEPIEDIFVANQIAYLGTWYNGLKIIDVSDANNPALLTTYLNHEMITEIELVGNLAYLAGDGLRVADVSDPAQPDLVGWYRGFEEWEAYAVAVSGSIACIGAISNDYEWRMIVLDIRDPSWIGTLGYADTIAGIFTLYISGDQIYAGGSDGIYVYKLSEYTLHLPIIHR
jgi:hypothetical protein